MNASTINVIISQQFLKHSELFFQLSEGRVHRFVNLVKKDSLPRKFAKIFQNYFFKEHLLTPVAESFPVWAIQY